MEWTSLKEKGLGVIRIGNSHVDPRPGRDCNTKKGLGGDGKRDGGQKTSRQWERKEERDAGKGKFDKREAGMWKNTWTMQKDDRKYVSLDGGIIIAGEEKNRYLRWSVEGAKKVKGIEYSRGGSPHNAKVESVSG